MTTEHGRESEQGNGMLMTRSEAEGTCALADSACMPIHCGCVGGGRIEGRRGWANVCHPHAVQYAGMGLRLSLRKAVVGAREFS